MVIKEGYKQTEIGVIPNDWEVKSLGDIAFVLGGGTPSTNINSYWNGDINWFTPTEIGSKKIVHPKYYPLEQYYLQVVLVLEILVF